MRSQVWADLAAALLTAVWVLVSPVLIVTGFFKTVSFWSAPNPEHAAGVNLMTAGAICFVAAPFLAAIITARTRRPKAPVIFGVGAFLGLFLVVFVLGGSQPKGPPAREPLPSGYCVEHSGGDNKCPGG